MLANGNGLVDLLLMNGTTVTSRTTVLNSPGWAVSHLADFNGDGKTDILWRHTDGSVALWLMDGTNVISTAILLGANSGWRVTHVADFNGDGKTDILWRHTDGSIAMWLMNGTTLTGGGVLLGAASGWTVTHTADFNGDGKADILWRHTDGSIVMWLMNGTVLTDGAVLLGAGSGWAVTHTGDFNGDGKADILYRHTDGRIAMWLMNGANLTGAAVLTDAGTGWQVVPSVGTAFPPVVPATADASRLMAQATFGATREEIDRVTVLGAASYIEEQFGIAQTSHLVTVRNNPLYPTQPWGVMMPSIWKQYFEANDQLRQRVAFALSQILVVSQQNNTIGDAACGTAYYLDTLGRNAFGNFRTLLKEVTLSPAMGQYLDMKQSAKTEMVNGVVFSTPSENFAREMMQLFSIGTVMLNSDGSPQFSNGKTIDTYSEETAREVARALTGWSFARSAADQALSWRWLYPDVPYPNATNGGTTSCTAWSSPMTPWIGDYRSADDKRTIPMGPHDTGVKTLLTYPGSANFRQSLPAGQTPEADLEDVIDNIFNHPNVGPFIADLLIQRLVTSNPSGAYVSRVAALMCRV